MKLYIVKYWVDMQDYAYQDIGGVYSSLEKAEEAIKLQNIKKYTVVIRTLDQ